MASPSRLTATVLLPLLVLATAPDLTAQPGGTDERIRYYQARLHRRPGEVASYARLGAAYLLKARETGEAQCYDLAGRTLQRCLDLQPDPATATRAASDLAAVRMARHEFRAALATARQALTFGAGDLAPYAMIGDAHVELGEYDLAETAYAMLRRLPGALYPHSRLANLRFLRGDTAGAVAEMRRGVDALADSGEPPEHVAWAHFRVGHFLFQAGDLPAAGRAHEAALAAYPGYHRALAGQAQVRTAERRLLEAAELYRKAIAAIPTIEAVAGLGDVLAVLGRHDEARRQYDLVEFIGRLDAANRVPLNRELALFYLDHDRRLPEALDLARRELDVRGDIYSHDVLAWALLKNGRAPEALGAMTEALRLGTQDARLHFHAGMIHRQLGDAGRARDHLERAFRINPRFHPLHADTAARALADLPAP